MHYNKLVRDQIPEIIRNKGENPRVHIADDQEYQKAIFEKLSEEITEFQENPCEEEMADILEVLSAMTHFLKMDWSQVQVIQKKKCEERGGFDERIILDEVS